MRRNRAVCDHDVFLSFLRQQLVLLLPHLRHSPSTWSLHHPKPFVYLEQQRHQSREPSYYSIPAFLTQLLLLSLVVRRTCRTADYSFVQPLRHLLSPLNPVLRPPRHSLYELFSVACLRGAGRCDDAKTRPWTKRWPLLSRTMLVADFLAYMRSLTQGCPCHQLLPCATTSKHMTSALAGKSLMHREDSIVV